MVNAKNAGDESAVASYQCDALFRRTVKSLPSASDRHLYYNDSWRPVEERLGSSTDAERRHCVGRGFALGLHPPRPRHGQLRRPRRASTCCATPWT
ncbi:MAG: hypothetical protein R3F11_23045 [Verrucomicrobiales bacterium]